MMIEQTTVFFGRGGWGESSLPFHSPPLFPKMLNGLMAQWPGTQGRGGRLLTQCNLITFLLRPRENFDNSIILGLSLAETISCMFFDRHTLLVIQVGQNDFPVLIGCFPPTTLAPSPPKGPNSKAPRNDWTSSQLLRRAICCSQLMNLRHLLLHVLDVNQMADSVITHALGTLVSSVNQLAPLPFDVQ